MWELIEGLLVMVGLFGVLLGGMLVLTLGADTDGEAADLPLGITRPRFPVATVVGIPVAQRPRTAPPPAEVVGTKR